MILGKLDENANLFLVGFDEKIGLKIRPCDKLPVLVAK